jgi:hypothetical protein
MTLRLSDILDTFCYQLEDESWDTDGRVTYSHDENATKGFIKVLAMALAKHGFIQSKGDPRCFERAESHELIEIEPGGAGCTGHLIHHIKAEAVA